MIERGRDGERQTETERQRELKLIMPAINAGIVEGRGEDGKETGSRKCALEKR